MQDEKRSIPQNDEHVVSPSVRIQNIIEYLADLWKSPHTPSNEDLKRIAEFVVRLPEAYISTGLTTLAENFVNGISLHILEMMATYQQKAEQDGICAEDIQRTFEDVFPGAFSTLETLRKQLSIQSLDALAALSNITIPLYTLSRADSAAEAQTWLYELSETYQNELQQENMLIDAQGQDKTSDQPKQSSNTN
ncbi:MAG TPA: hypothetical protein VK134_03975, partial [Ktedonobacteraceae bacterium]|nr:hypothetical protein [Ktedonobacteraceae bacterium]